MMAQIRCPMCGKPNPEEMEVCQFCQARLKPLIINPQEPSEDWLKPANDDELVNNQDDLGQPEAPDWLRSLRSRDIPIEENNEEEAMSDPAEWLRTGLGDPELLREQQSTSKEADWLADFRSKDTSGDSEEQKFSEHEEIETTEHNSVPEDIDTGIPNWLTGARQESETEYPEPVNSEIQRSEDEIEPEWLAQLRANRAIETPGESQDTIPDPNELPDWLKSGELNIESGLGNDLSQKAPSEDVPTWTSYFSEESTLSVDEEVIDKNDGDGEEPLLPEDDLPEWLKEKPESEATSADIPQPAEKAGPDLVSNESPPWYASVPGRPIKPTDQLSQWLRLETTEPDVSPDKPQKEEFLDWLNADEETGSSTRESEKDELKDGYEPPAPEDEEMSNIAFDTARSIEKPEINHRASDIQESSLDDEFAALEKELFSGEVSDESIVSSGDEGGLVSGMEPSWLVELRQKMGNSPEQMTPKVAPFAEDSEHEIPAEDFTGQELPDWLIDVHAQEAIEQIAEAALPLDLEETGATETSTGLAQADLPPWLEAMRPVEAVAAAASDIVDDREHNIESAGPLAGLKGILPAEADVTIAHKPGSFGLKLQVSDMQRTRADMLQELIQNETYAVPIPRKPAISSQRVLQIIIAATLILAILSTLIINTPIAKVPGFPLETGAVSEIINSLNSSDIVLVAVDFQPSFSGEMEAAGSTVLDHLMLRGAKLVMVSTHPSGPLQAERLINLVNQRYGHSYGDDQVTNLGYISGGRSGLLAFASSPRQLAKVTIDTGTNPWDGGALIDVTNVSDFSATIVMTENPDTAKMWVEQFQPHLVAKPLLMVLSAQSQPVVRPYYEASPQQVQGMVSGTAGAAAYENLLGRTGIGRGQWGAYSLSVLAACLLILVGGVVNALPALTARVKKTKPGGGDQL